MARVFVKDTELTDIANAIREKNGTEETYKPSEMGDAVRAIEVSGGGDGDFVGIKYSDFTGGRGTPKVADASSLYLDNYMGQEFGGYPYLFANISINGNGGWNTKLQTVYLPKGIKVLQVSMFNSCGELKKIHNIESVTTINNNCFVNCKSLVDFPYLPNLKQIMNNAFQYCTGLTEVKLYNAENVSLVSTSFNACTNIKDIYVPWSEGEVANAPWGATNATVHYNTTYDENHNPIV